MDICVLPFHAFWQHFFDLYIYRIYLHCNVAKQSLTFRGINLLLAYISIAHLYFLQNCA